MAMKLLYGTGNPAKLEDGRRELSPLGLEIIGLCDLDRLAPDVAEVGKTPIENAREKALAYYDAFKMPVFSADSGLFIDGLPDGLQPGAHIRRPQGRYLDDAECIEYYASLARKYGTLTARYQDAVCLVVDREHVYDFTYVCRPFGITDKIHPCRRQGYPLDTISVWLDTGEYCIDAPSSEKTGWDEIREFMKKNLWL